MYLTQRPHSTKSRKFMILLWGFEWDGAGGRGETGTLAISPAWKELQEAPCFCQLCSVVSNTVISPWVSHHLSRHTGEWAVITTSSHLSGFYYVLGGHSPENSWSCLFSAQVGGEELFVWVSMKELIMCFDLLGGFLCPKAWDEGGRLEGWLPLIF